MFMFMSITITSLCGLSLLAQANKHVILSSSSIVGVFGDWGVILDPISLSFVSLLFLVTTFILVFSISYLSSDVLNTQFFMVLGSFAFSMMILIFSENIGLFFLGWDGLGISSFWLILWYQNNKGNMSGAHTFTTMRIGDLFLLLGVLFWAGFQSTNLYMFMGLAPFMFVMGAATKSAQVPFVTWLPLAMAAPTPVSALVHSSTLVTAGIYMLMRAIFYGSETPSALISLGACTALLGAYCSVMEFDLKKAIAYSTLSHCGLMMYGLGLNCWDLVFFHLCVHALFKSLLFLLAGWVLSTAGGGQDVRSLGGLNSKVMKTFWCMNGLMMASLPSLGVWYSKHAVLGVQTVWAFPELMFLLSLSALSGVYIWRLPTWVLGTSGAKATGDIPPLFKMSLASHLSVGILVLLGSPSAVPELSGVNFHLSIIWILILVPLVYCFFKFAPSWSMSAQNYLDQMDNFYLSAPSKLFESGSFEEMSRTGESISYLSSATSMVMMNYWTKGIVLTGAMVIFMCI